MDWDRSRRDRFDDHRGGESYRPGSSRGYIRRSRSPPRIRSPRLVADTWVPSTGRTYGRTRSRSPPPFRRRSSRSPSFYNRDVGPVYSKAYSSPRRFSPRRDGRPRSPTQPPRRPRSPYNEDRPRDMSWNQSTPRRPRDHSPSSRDTGYFKRERHLLPATEQYRKPRSPSRHGREDDSKLLTNPRPRSPLSNGRKERHHEWFPGQRRRSPSPRSASYKRTSAPGSISNSRRSSPLPDRGSATSADIRARSPAVNHHVLARRLSRDSDRSSCQDERVKSRSDPKGRSRSPTSRRTSKGPQFDTASPRISEIQGTDPSLPNPTFTGSIPSQPKAYIARTQSPQSGPPHGPKTLASHNRTSNISLLSAPTRPRGGPSFKEGGWTGAGAGATGRRGPVPVATHGTPLGPRSSHIPSAPAAEAHRHHASYRQNSVVGSSFPPNLKQTNHLVGLRPIIPGGKFLPSGFDATTEKRLSQLDLDKERLFEQIAVSQKLKRVCIRDWDKSDRESSICALKSELADGHLQCITDSEGTHVRTTF